MPDEPPLPPDDPERPEDPEKDEELFTLFRGLRERIFDGSSELVTRVMKSVEDQIHKKADESLAASVLVQLTNFVTSWLDPAVSEPSDETPNAEPSAPNADPAAHAPDAPEEGDDE